GDSVAQAAQFTVTGNASGGLLPYSIVLAPTFAGRGTHALIPSSDHPSLRQKMVLMKGAGPVSVEFHDFVLSDTAGAILGRHGYEVPERRWSGAHSASRCVSVSARYSCCCRSASGSAGCWPCDGSAAGCSSKRS